MTHMKFSHFQCPLPGPSLCQCDFEVDFSPGRFEVTVHLHDLQGQAVQDLSRVLNTFYRQELFRHLLPASRVSWYYHGRGGRWHKIHLEGLPGGYTGASVAHADHVTLLNLQEQQAQQQAQ